MQVQPSFWARMFGHDWVATPDGPRLRVSWRTTGWHTLSGAALRERTIDRTWPWSVLAIPGEAYAALGGLNRETRHALDDAIGQVIAEADRLERLSATFIADGHQVQQWRAGVLRDLDTLRNRWIPREIAARWQADRPDLASPVFEKVRDEPELAAFLATQPAPQRTGS